MQFGIIKRRIRAITLVEWQQVIGSHNALVPTPDRKAVNPFTKKPMVISGEGKANYMEGGEHTGNISLEDGALLTTGVPKKVCAEIARMLDAKVYEDDRT